MAAALGLRPDQVLDLSASLNPVAPDVAALAAPHLDALGRYPDVDAAEATLAAGLDLPPDRLVLTAGGAQAIALVAAHLGAGPGRRARVLPVPPPPAAARPRRPALAVRPPQPVGRCWPAPDETAGVWDEAFLPLAAGAWTRGRPGWALGSLTKAFACPGLRLGYAVAPDADGGRRPAPGPAGLGRRVAGLRGAARPAGRGRPAGVDRGGRQGPGRARRRARRPRLGPAAVRRPVGAGARPPPGCATRSPARRSSSASCASFGLADHVRIAVPDGDGLDRLDRALAAAAGDAGPERRP